MTRVYRWPEKFLEPIQPDHLILPYHMSGQVILAIKDNNEKIITDSIQKADILNSSKASVFCCHRNIPEIKLATWGETFIININVIRKN